MKNVVADLGMTFIYKAAGIFSLFSPRVRYDYPAAVWDTEQLLIVRVNKSDTLLSFLNVLIKPFLYKAVAIKIVVAPCGVAAQQIGVFLRIHSETVLRAIAALKGAIRILPCIRTHIGTAFQQSVFIGAQSIDNLVKLRLELVRFPLCSGVRPSGIKAVSRAVKISTQMTDIGGLSLKLHTLSIGVFLLGRG